MRKKIVAGNWKMNPLPSEAVLLLNELKEAFEDHTDEIEKWIAPPAVYVGEAAQTLEDSNIEVGVQNFYPEETGAYTGEISVEMISEMGASFAIIGHSERRSHFGEPDELLLRKLNHAISQGVTAIYCIGEQLPDREAGNHFAIIEQQLQNVLFKVHGLDETKLVVAYEPVWAIGTGETASAEQAQEMHAHIRHLIRKEWGPVAENIPLLYGGSCKPGNAGEIFAGEDVDGGLIGGASLNADDFLAIANAF